MRRRRYPVFTSINDSKPEPLGDGLKPSDGDMPMFKGIGDALHDLELFRKGDDAACLFETD